MVIQNSRLREKPSAMEVLFVDDDVVVVVVVVVIVVVAVAFLLYFVQELIK